MSDLPPGFQLDDGSDLPQGFQLDTDTGAGTPTSKFQERVPATPGPPIVPNMQEPIDPREAVAAGFRNIVTRGWGDEASGLVNQALGGSYEQGRDVSRERQAAAHEQHPVLYTGGQVLGGVSQAAIPVGAAVRGGSLGLNMLRTGAIGGLEGVAHGAGDTDGTMAQRAHGAAQEGLTGSALGMAGPLVGNLLGRAWRGLTGRYETPNIEQKAADIYRAANQKGVTYDPNHVTQLIDHLKREAAAEGASDNGTLAAAFRGIDRKTQGMAPQHADPTEVKWSEFVGNEPPKAPMRTVPNMEEVGKLRNDLRNAATSAPFGSDERRIAWQIVHKFDEAMPNMDVVPGSASAKEAFRLKKEADALWRAKKKSDIIEAAQSQVENSNKSTRQAVTQLLTPTKGEVARGQKLSSTVLKNFSPSEIKDLQKARGTLTQKALELTGKFAQYTSPGHLAGGIPGVVTGAVQAGVGTGFRKLASKLADRRLNLLNAKIRSGGRILPQEYSNTERALALLLMGQHPSIEDQR